MNMYGNANQGMDDIIFIQGVSLIFKKANTIFQSNQHIFSYKQAWFTCYIESYKTSTRIWVEHDHIVFLDITCLTTLISNISK